MSTQEEVAEELQELLNELSVEELDLYHQAMVAERDRIRVLVDPATVIKLLLESASDRQWFSKDWDCV